MWSSNDPDGVVVSGLPHPKDRDCPVRWSRSPRAPVFWTALFQAARSADLDASCLFNFPSHRPETPKCTATVQYVLEGLDRPDKGWTRLRRRRRRGYQQTASCVMKLFNQYLSKITLTRTQASVPWMVKTLGGTAVTVATATVSFSNGRWASIFVDSRDARIASLD